MTWRQSNILIDQHNHVQLADLGLSPVSHNPTDDDDSSVLWEAPEVQTSLAVRGDLPRDVYAYALVCCMVSHIEFFVRSLNACS
jgi:hypothetical protein